MKVLFTFARGSPQNGYYVEVSAPSRPLARAAMRLAGFTDWWAWPWDEDTFYEGARRHGLELRCRLLIAEDEIVHVVKQEIT